MMHLQFAQTGCQLPASKVCQQACGLTAGLLLGGWPSRMLFVPKGLRNLASPYWDISVDTVSLG